jgi:hypothetical protein
VHPEDLFKLDADAQDLERPRALRKLDQEVDIAPRALISPGNRPEDSDGPTVMARNDRLDLIPMGIHQLPQRPRPGAGHATTLRLFAPSEPSRAGHRVGPVHHATAT